MITGTNSSIFIPGNYIKRAPRREPVHRRKPGHYSHYGILFRSLLSMKYIPIIQITMHSMSMPAMSTPQLFHLIHEDACESQMSCALWFFGTLAVAPWESGYVTYGPWPRFTMTNVPSTPAGYFG